MAERGETVEELAVRDASATYAVEPDIATAEDVPPGYKRTEVGVIPDSWEVKGIYELEKEKALRLYRGKVISQKDIDTNPGEYPIYSSSVKNEGVFGRYGDYMFDEELITWSVDGGGNFFYRQKHKFSVTNVCGYMRTDHARINYRFLASQLQLLHSRKAFDYQSKAHPSVIRREYVVPLPPLYEQRAIATALSDADALIESLDRLIAKKRAIKQAAMQQLLTGQTRLPGFTGEWETKRLGDVAEIDPENLGSSTPPSFTFNYISLEQVEQGRLLGWSVERFSTSPSRARRVLRSGDILVSTVRPNLQSHYFFYGGLPNPVCSTGFAVVRCNTRPAHAGYVYAHLFGSEVNRQIDRIIAGSNYPAISSGDVKRLKIPFPSLEEQTAIATVLADMDIEIEALERRRDKARQIKQGMMQQLLIGRVRLVTPEVAA